MYLRAISVFVCLLVIAPASFALVVEGNDDTSKENCVQKLIHVELQKNKIQLEITRVYSSGVPIPMGPKRYSYVAKNPQNFNFFGTILVDVESNETKTQCELSKGTLYGVSLGTNVFTLNQEVVRY